MRKYFISICCLLFNLALSQAQIGSVTEAQVRSELEKRGISEDELIQEMNARGIEVEDLENLNASQLAELEAIVAELETEVANSSQSTTPNPIPQIQKEEFLATPSVQDVEALKNEIEDVIVDELEADEKPGDIYGHAFFKDRSLSLLETSTDVKAPGNYILGAGDKIVISIFGISREELAYEIDNDGYIEVNNRKIFLKGLTLNDAETKLFESLSRFYRFNQGQFDVSLSYSRTVNINIQGEVTNPGGYTISAINTVFNGLIAAGGPTEIGSLREILLIKKNGEIVTLDFYSFLKDPGSARNVALEEGDVIVVPVARKVVSIRGGVRRPMRYEVLEKENLGDLLEMAGGFSSNANRSIAQILRFGLSGSTYLDVQDSNIASFALEDGDQIKFNTIDNAVPNYVAIKGAVINAGEYERTKDMSVQTLLDLAELKDDASLDLAFIRRSREDGKVIYIPIDLSIGSSDRNINLINRDEISINSLSLVNENVEFQIGGAVKRAGSFVFGSGEQISVKNAIELAGGLRRDASGIAIIHTVDPLNPNVKTYERIDLSAAYDRPDDFVLTGLDSLEVFSQALFDERAKVSITGAVNSPGEFQYGQGMILADVLTMAGGFRIGAAVNKVEVYRLIIEDNEPTKTVIANLNVDRNIAEGGENLDFALRAYDEIVVRFVPGFELQKIVSIEGEVKYPGQYSLIKDNETIREILVRAGGITDEAFPSAAQLYRTEDSLGTVVVKLDKVLEDPNSRFNFRLKSGDRLLIPKSKDFVTIVGATNASKLFSTEILGSQMNLNVPYHNGKSAKFYIEEYAGGISDNGSLNEVYVKDANGEIQRTRNFFLFKSYPEVEMGSKIIVGSKPPKTEKQKDRADIDWSKVLADSVGQAVSILSLLLLIERL